MVWPEGFLGPGSKSEIRFGTEFLPPSEMPQTQLEALGHILLAMSYILKDFQGCWPRLFTENGGLLTRAEMRMC